MPTAEHEHTECEHDHPEQHWLGGAEHFERTPSRYNTRKKVRDYMQKVRDVASRPCHGLEHAGAVGKRTRKQIEVERT